MNQSRFGVTEFPSGTRYYVATLDSAGNPDIPFTVGSSFSLHLQV